MAAMSRIDDGTPAENHRSGSNLPPAFAFQAMGVPPGSMTLTSLCDGIPPVYARFIAKAFIGQAERRGAA